MLLLRHSRFRRKPFREKLLVRKSISLLPNIFTLGNAFFGYLSIVFTANEDFIGASYFILLGALFDFLDGRVARYLKISSEFGVQLDSFSDLVSFCLAPAFLMYFWQLNKLGFIGFLGTAFFLIAGLLRLAKFNLTSSEQSLFFLGVPTTISGCFFATLLLNSGKIIPSNFFVFILLFLEILFGFLMISSIRFPTFKGNIRLGKNWLKAIFLVFVAFMAVMKLHTLLLLLFLFYFAFSLLLIFKQGLFFQDE
ncbi:MAG: CDP-diacylglycerol--serine O-phosphatidyltransferase [bacterium]